MNIRLNGSVWVDDTEILFDNLEIEVDEDLELPFDELDEDDFEEFDFYEDDDEDYCDGNCEYCNDCDSEDDLEVEFDLDDDERFDNYTDDYKNFLSEYVRKIYGTDFCPYCIAEVLNLFFEDEF